MKRIVTSSLAFCLALFSIPYVLANEDSEGDTIKRWIEGPVRYIITFKEEKAFKKLTTDIQRAFFIYQFWFRRDPTPGTLRNEYREIFWDRVITANKMFNETTKPGWKTDRGEILILLGPPNIIESDTNPNVPFPPPRISTITPKGISYSDSISSEETISETSGTRDLTMDTGFRGIRRWIYFQSKNKRIPPHMVIAFYKDSAGEYVLSDNPQHYTNLFPGLEARSDLLSRFAFQRSSFSFTNPIANIMNLRLSDTLPPFSFDHSIAFKLDLAEIIQTPTIDDLIDEVVTTHEFFNRMKAHFRSYFFLDANNKTYAVLQGAIPKKEIIPQEGADPILISFFGKMEEEKGKEIYMFANDSTIPGSIMQDNDDLILLANVTLPPGEYHAKIGVLNLPYGIAGNFNMPLSVPDLCSHKPTLSSIVLTSSMEYSKSSSAKFPGDISIKPKKFSTYTKDENFGIYYHVYHLDIDKKTGMPDFNITYKFYKKEGEAYALILPPTVKERLQYEVQGWTFPLDKWPDGEYLLELTAVDNISERSFSQTIEFQVK